ncbi:MAG: hypothetical protein SOX82_06270 [Eubacteriales bacterium]|nr:hypothetical protein [Eubacteriales bacterium]
MIAGLKPNSNADYIIYKYTGDTSVIEENVSLIMRYLCYISSRRDERGLIAVGLGDWVDPFRHENGHIASPLELTDSVTVYDMAKKSANA